MVIARDIQTGAPKWESSIGKSQFSALVDIQGENFILRNGVLVASVEYHVTGLDALTGSAMWQYSPPLDTIDQASPRPGYMPRSRMAADDNTVFIPAWGASVSALDIKSGSIRWVWRVDPTIPNRSGSPGVSLAGDTVFVAVWHFLNQLGTRSEAWIVALDKLSGSELWRVALPRESTGTMIDCAPRISNNLVIVTLSAGDLFAVDRRNQQVAWHIPTQLPKSQYDLGTDVMTSAEVRGDVVYANGSDHMLHAYRVTDGSPLWSSDAGQFTSDMLVTEKFIYATIGPNIYVYNRSTGERYGILSHPRKSTNYVFSSGAAADGDRVFTTLTDGAWSFLEP